MTLILVGIIGAFTGLFLSTGIEGFIASKRNSEVAIKAQIAMDRLSAELRHVTQVTSWTPPSLSYKCSDPQLPGTRTLIFDTTADEIRISIDGGPQRVIVDDLDTYSMAWSARQHRQLRRQQRGAYLTPRGFQAEGCGPDLQNPIFSTAFRPETIIAGRTTTPET